MQTLSIARLLASLVLALACPSALQAEEQEGVSGATPGARALWAELVRASGGGDLALEPIRAFTIKASVLTRNGVQTNETEFDYEFLAPDCISFALPDGKETGRSGLREAEHWLQTNDGVLSLAGREYKEDRRQIAEMHAIAKNFVALSDPARLTIRSLELLEGEPSNLGDQLLRDAQKLRWLRLESPDFALFLTDPSKSGEQTYVVELALQTAGDAKGLPRYAIIREQREFEIGTAPPMLIRLDEFKQQDQRTIPFRLHVFGMRGVGATAVFADKPSQEVDVLEANLRPDFTVEHFRR